MQQDEWAIPSIKIRGRLNLWVLMVAIVFVAFGLVAAVRPRNAGGVGTAIVGACVVCLAYKRLSNVVSLRQAKGLATSRSRKLGLFLVSSAIATAVIAFSDLAFLIGRLGYGKTIDSIFAQNHSRVSDEPGHMLIGLGIGVSLTIGVASSLRRVFLSTYVTVFGHSRRWKMMRPVGLAILLGAVFGGELMRERYVHCQFMAEYHAGPQARIDVPNKAALHAWLSRWYERAALRPWLPVEPDRIPPELK